MNSNDGRVQIQVYKSSEVTLNAPPEKVWPFILDFSSFNDTFEKVEVIEGQANTVGAVSRLTKRKGEWWMEPYVVKIIHLEPGRKIVWKMFSEKDDEFNNFVEFSLHGEGGQTRFTIRLYKEHRIHAKTSQDIEDARKAIIAASDKLEQTIMFPNLKRLTEKPEV
jgi:hypothetical protein